MLDYAGVRQRKGSGGVKGREGGGVDIGWRSVSQTWPAVASSNIGRNFVFVFKAGPNLATAG